MVKQLHVYSLGTRSIPWLLMTWLNVSPGHGMDCTGKRAPGFPYGSISTTYAISTLRNDTKIHFYIFSEIFSTRMVMKHIWICHLWLATIFWWLNAWLQYFQSCTKPSICSEVNELKRNFLQPVYCSKVSLCTLSFPFSLTLMIPRYHQTSNISHTKILMFLTSSCTCLCTIYWSQVLSREWRGSYSSADSADPTTSEWSTSLLPPKVCFILKVWQ